jgi:hypothetical protein
MVNNFTVNLISGGRYVSELIYTVDGNVIKIEFIKTQDPNNRKKKYSQTLLAVVLWCAKRAGYKYAKALSVFINNKNKAQSTRFIEGTTRPRPLSAGLFNKFNFEMRSRNNENGTENRYLNMNRGMPGVNSVVRELTG